jgi:hypothetical protein
MSLAKQHRHHVTHRLGDTLDVVTKNLAVTLSTTLSETLHIANEYQILHTQYYEVN